MEKVQHKQVSENHQQYVNEHIADLDYERPEIEQSADRFSEREISWLQFNERVLELAEDSDTPLLERLSFSAIFASNLDEFFMVRVAGLKRRIKAGLATVSASGTAPTELLEKVLQISLELQKRHASNYQNNLKPALDKAGVEIVEWSALPEAEKVRVRADFDRRIFPILTPLAVDPAHPFPYISGNSLSIGALVENPKSGKRHFARIKVPTNVSRYIRVDAASKKIKFISIEDVIAHNLEHLFPGMQTVEVKTFRVTRNEDIDMEEDDAENLLKAMEQELQRRRFGAPIRLEIDETTSEELIELLIEELGVEEDEVFALPAPLDHTGFFQIAGSDRPDLHYAKFMPKTNRQLARVESANPADIFECIRKGDILLYHPYDSFSTSVQEFLTQAANDPKVLAIKQTLYRTSGDSPIIDALITAAQNGKQVLALVEIKARFDEEANIQWARKLEKAGVHVVYGIVGLKTHCKLALVVRQEEKGVIRRYAHVGTGNYNPKTARIYTDHGLLTCDENVGEDITVLFNQLSGYAPKAKYSRLLVAPKSIRKGLLHRIENEISAARAGKTAWIKMKMNSIVDEQLIDAFYRASQAGVKVNLVVRGICAIRPGVKGLSENIEVRSVLGRFLEHSRIYAFANEFESKEVVQTGGPEVWIGSADLMHRNLDRRVEALVKIVVPKQKDALIAEIDEQSSDEVQSWHMQSDGTYKRVAKGLPDSQDLEISRHKFKRVKI